MGRPALIYRPLTSASTLYSVEFLAAVLTVLLSQPMPARAQDAQEPGAVRARLRQATPLTVDEIARAVDAINTTIARRPVTVTDGVQSAAVEAPARDLLLLVLSGTVAVADLGLKTGPTGAVRGLRSPATPPRSEVGASQILWIDVESLVPRRFEFLYDVPGMGDIAYDLVFQ